MKNSLFRLRIYYSLRNKDRLRMILTAYQPSWGYVVSRVKKKQKHTHCEFISIPFVHCF